MTQTILIGRLARPSPNNRVRAGAAGSGGLAGCTGDGDKCDPGGGGIASTSRVDMAYGVKGKLSNRQEPNNSGNYKAMIACTTRKASEKKITTSPDRH